MQKLPVPKQLFVVDVVLANLVTYVLSLAPLFLVMIVVGRSIPWTVLALPIYAVPLILITMAASLVLSVSVLYFEDIHYLAEVGLRALFFLTPILYSSEHLPEGVRDWIVLNPLFRVVEFLRQIFYTGELPLWSSYLWSVAASMLLLAVAVWVFNKAARRILYVA